MVPKVIEVALGPLGIWTDAISVIGYQRLIPMLHADSASVGFAVVYQTSADGITWGSYEEITNQFNVSGSDDWHFSATSGIALKGEPDGVGFTSSLVAPFIRFAADTDGSGQKFNLYCL